MLTQIDRMAADSGYKGMNLLNGTTSSLTVKFNEAGSSLSSLNIAGFNATSAATSSGLALSTALG